MPDRAEGQEPAAGRNADQGEFDVGKGELADYTAAVTQADRDLAKEGRRAKRRRTTRKALEVSGRAASVVAENAADVAIGIISSLSP